MQMMQQVEIYEEFYNGFDGFEKSEALHFNLPENIGDVHPYYENGKLYLFYLITDGTFSSSLLTSDDMLNYKKEVIKHHNRLPSRPYYTLNVIKDKEGTYRSFFGADLCILRQRHRSVSYHKYNV